MMTAATLGLVLTALLSAADSRGTPVDKIVAVVAGEPLTESELMIEARVALAMREGEAAAVGPIDSELFGAFRDYVVNQMVVTVHARRVGAVDVPRDQIDLASKKFIQKFRSSSSYEAFMRRFDIPETKIRGLLRRDLRNQVFVSQRLRSRRLSESRGPDRESAAADVLLNELLEEMKRTVEIRFLGPEEQLELQ